MSNKIKKCPPGKVLTPKTNRCIIDRSKSKTNTRKLLKKECPPGKVLNTKTNRCVIDRSKTKPKVSKTKKICPPGKVLNPKTNRCVIDRSKSKTKKLLKKVCPHGKVLNSKTNRCVIDRSNTKSKPKPKPKPKSKSKPNPNPNPNPKSKPIQVLKINSKNTTVLQKLSPTNQEVKTLLKPPVKEKSLIETITLREFKKPKVAKSNFIGNWLNTFFGMIYLIKKNKNVCFPVSIEKRYDISFYQQISIFFSDFSNNTIKNNISNYSLKFPKNMSIKIKECKKRFIAIPLYIKWDLKGAHANMILIDNKFKTVERFEPYGKLIHNIGTRPYNIELKLDDELKKYFESNYNLKYYDPFEFCPIIGFQRLEEQELNSNQSTAIIKKGDPMGFCAAWSLWYVHLRLSFPNISREKIINRAILKLKRNKNSLRTFIRNYAGFIQKQIKKIYNLLMVKYNMNKISKINNIYFDNAEMYLYDEINNIIKDHTY